ncbi:hypothetical protein N332_09252, partial [Mesitornis unicolor]
LAATFSTIAFNCSHLKELQSDYSPRLAGLRDSINQTLRRCGTPCDTVSPDGLTFSTNFSTIPSVEQQLKALNDVSGSNIVADLE